jgi:hypothetical protein
MSSLSAIVGLAAVAAVFFVITRFGEQFGEGAKGISEGVSAILSPRVVPTIGFQTEAPQWLSDILGGTRTEDRPLSTVDPSPIRTPEGTIDPFWLVRRSGIIPLGEKQYVRPETRQVTQVAPIRLRTEDRELTMNGGGGAR